MKTKSTILSILILSVIFTFNSCDSGKEKNKSNEYVLVIHGGAGRILKENISPEREKEYILKLSEALTSGAEILKNGGPSLDAVETAINILEDSPLFNAGKGAVFTEKGENEMDASIMDGRTLNAGAVAGVKTIKNPISAARKVMTDSKHVLLAGEGAEEFAASMGLEIVEDQKQNKPAPEITQKILFKCGEYGMLLGRVGLYGNVIRIAPPLIITEEEAEIGVEIIEKVLQELE